MEGEGEIFGSGGGGSDGSEAGRVTDLTVAAETSLETAISFR